MGSVSYLDEYVERMVKASGFEYLVEAIQEIAEIIHMEMPLKYQDKWLTQMIEVGIYKPDIED